MRKVISTDVSQGTSGNRDAIKDIVDQFAKGEVGKGIVNTLFTALDMILGSYSASYN
jgi:hypothetical protein